MAKSLQVGDIIPDISLRDQNGKIIDIGNYRGKKPLAIIFYPWAGSNGCEQGSCNSSDITKFFDRAGVTLIRISGQSSAKQESWFPIYTNNNFKVREMFGIPPVKIGKYSQVLSLAFGVNTGRITFITNAEGKIIYKTDSQAKVKCQSGEINDICLILDKMNRYYS